MNKLQGLRLHARRATALGMVAVITMLLCSQTAIAQNLGFRQNSVGGVIIDAEGVVRKASVNEREAFLKMLRADVNEARGEVAQKAKLRMVSLKGLQSAILEALETGDALPEEIRYLAGLQRVEYVFVYPEQNDIVIAGPAEPWVVRDDASVVGVTTGKPVLLIDDLVTAMRSVETARNGGISCSIEPTAEGHQRLSRLLAKARLRSGQNPKFLEPQMKQAFGPQMVKLSGVPAESHYARILVAADYQMKRLAMGLEPSMVQGFPSYIEMARATITQNNSNPRWWMACNYSGLNRTKDGLAWQLSGPGVKAMTETDVLGANGAIAGRAKAEPKAQQWADMMTENYDALSSRFAVFGQLRNVMDLSVISTLIVQERLDEKAGINLDLLFGRGTEMPVAVMTAPTAISPECSFIRSRKGWVVTASGGVDINAFQIVEQQSTNESLSTVRGKSSNVELTWWWNS